MIINGALLDLFFSPTRSAFTIVPFVFDHKLGGGAIASGKWVILSDVEFMRRGFFVVKDLFEQFDTATFEKSELYQVISADERRLFFETNFGLVLAYNNKMNQVDVFRNDTKMPFGEISFRDDVFYESVKDKFAKIEDA